MAKQMRMRKCKNCHVFFPPNPRNAWHQQYCFKPECRKASKAASRRKWLMKEENRDHFRGPENVQRVQEWRKSHPGYWRSKTLGKEEALQDLLPDKTLKNPSLETPLPKAPLQDLLSSQTLVVIGLIAHLTGCALQDHIALTAHRLQQLGADILNGSIQIKGGSYDPQAPHLFGADQNGPQPVQLGGSPSGP